MTDFTAPITEVTVYSDRALVKRSGTMHLEVGTHELRVNDLPQFVRDSLRANGEGPRGTRILNVDVTTAFYNRPPDSEIRALQDELDQLQQRRQLLKAQQESLGERRHWLKLLGEQSREFARGLAQGQMSSEDCAEFFRFMADQSLQDAQTGQRLELQIKQAQEEIDAKKRQLAAKEGNTNPDRQAAIVEVELTQAGDFTLELSYIVFNASWYPHYDVRVNKNEEDTTGSVDLTYTGMVQQGTGEDWQNVALSLSTARPSQAAILPELDPWYINVYSPPPMVPAAPMAYAAPRSAKASFTLAAGSAGAPTGELMLEAFDTQAQESVAAEVVTATAEHTGTAIVFRAGRSVDIPSDNSPHKTTIARENLPCKFDYVSAPAIEQYAHLRATITNNTNNILLQGDSSIFLENEYVGTTSIKSTAPSEEFKIYLGIDDSIKVKRELIERSVDKGNLLQNDLRRITYAYRITVTNYSTSPKEVVVRDHLPVSKHERLKVKVTAVTPPPTERTKLEILKWRQTLAADQELRIEYRFVVEHPQSLRITGLSS